MLELAAEANSILSSETEELDHPIWSSKTMFLQNVPYFNRGQYWGGDDESVDLMALVVLDDFPAEVWRAEVLGVHFQELQLIVSRLSTKFFVRISK